MENNNQNQEINNTTTSGSVKVEIKIQSNSTRSEASENGLIPVSKDEKDFTVNFELSSEKVKNIMKMVGEAAGDLVKEKISKVGE